MILFGRLELRISGNDAGEVSLRQRGRPCIGERYRAEHRVDTTAPLHQNGHMRLTVNLEPDVYALAKSLAKSEDCSISGAVNRLLRRSLEVGAKHDSGPSTRPRKRNHFVISRGGQAITADTVRRIEREDDET